MAPMATRELHTRLWSTIRTVSRCRHASTPRTGVSVSTTYKSTSKSTLVIGCVSFAKSIPKYAILFDRTYSKLIATASGLTTFSELTTKLLPESRSQLIQCPIRILSYVYRQGLLCSNVCRHLHYLETIMLCISTSMAYENRCNICSEVQRCRVVRRSAIDFCHVDRVTCDDDND